MVRTVISSSWPKACATCATFSADSVLISRVRSNPNNSPDALRASTTPSERNVRDSSGLSKNWLSSYSTQYEGRAAGEHRQQRNPEIARDAGKHGQILPRTLGLRQFSHWNESVFLNHWLSGSCPQENDSAQTSPHAAQEIPGLRSETWGIQMCDGNLETLSGHGRNGFRDAGQRRSDGCV